MAVTCGVAHHNEAAAAAPVAPQVRRKLQQLCSVACQAGAPIAAVARGQLRLRQVKNNRPWMVTLCHLTAICQRQEAAGSPTVCTIFGAQPQPLLLDDGCACLIRNRPQILDKCRQATS